MALYNVVMAQANVEPKCNDDSSRFVEKIVACRESPDMIVFEPKRTVQLWFEPDKFAFSCSLFRRRFSTSNIIYRRAILIPIKPLVPKTLAFKDRFKWMARIRLSGNDQGPTQLLCSSGVSAKISGNKCGSGTARNLISQCNKCKQRDHCEPRRYDSDPWRVNDESAPGSALNKLKSEPGK